MLCNNFLLEVKKMFRLAKVSCFLFSLLLLFTSSHVISQGLPTADGVIQSSEYENKVIVKEGMYELYWTIDESKGIIYFGIIGYTSGWIAIGIDPSSVMKDADMYFGFVDNGQEIAKDAYSTGTYGPHPEDTELGGSNDILSFGVSEESGKTIFEFSRKLNTGDNYDKVLKDEGTNFIWALGSGDDWTKKHDVGVGAFTINLYSKQTNTILEPSTSQKGTSSIIGFLGITTILLATVIFIKSRFKLSP